MAPDFMHAVRDPVAAANAGLDIPGLGLTEGRTGEDFTSGRIPAERLDEIVRRILFAIFAAGLSITPCPTRPAAGAGQHPRSCRPGGPDRRRGTVLLRTVAAASAGHRPGGLDGGDRHGPRRCPVGHGWVAVRAGAAGAAGHALGRDHARAGNGVGVAFAQGSFGDAALPAVPTEVLTPPDSAGMGLLGEYWNAETPDGEPVLTVVDPTVDILTAPEGLAAPVWWARWTGTITPSGTGGTDSRVLAGGIIQLEVDGCWSQPVNGSSARSSTARHCRSAARSSCGPDGRWPSSWTTRAAPHGR